nr:MAG TPA: hypothetical protein [Caudoviricetes sp.]
MGFRKNNRRDPEYYDAILIKKLKITEYNNLDDYKEANLVDDSDLWNLYEKVGDVYIRTKDTTRDVSKTYYIKTIKTLADNPCELVEEKGKSEKTLEIPFKFSYSTQYAFEKAFNARNTWTQDVSLLIKTTSKEEFTSTDRVKIGDSIYSILNIYYEIDSRTNRVGDPSFIKYITLQI